MSALALRVQAPLGRCLFSRVTLKSLIAIAFKSPAGIPSIAGGPNWVDSDKFDIQAKAEDPATSTEANLLVMLRNLIVDKFSLRFHIVTKDTAGFRLVVARGGTKLKSTTAPYSGVSGNAATASAMNATLPELAVFLSHYAGGPVVDKTGLTGGYEFTLRLDSIFTAVQEDLGLRLEPERLPMDNIVIDHAEEPLPR